MPLIERENKKKPQRISVCLGQEVFEELSRYCQFMESSCDHVIGALIQTMIPKDREYQAWKTEPHEVPPPEMRVRMERRGRKKVSGANAPGKGIGGSREPLSA